MTEDQSAERKRQAMRRARKLGIAIPKPVRVRKPAPVVCVVHAPVVRPVHCGCGRVAVAWYADGRSVCAKHMLENVRIPEVRR